MVIVRSRLFLRMWKFKKCHIVSDCHIVDICLMHHNQNAHFRHISARFSRFLVRNGVCTSDFFCRCLCQLACSFCGLILWLPLAIALQACVRVRGGRVDVEMIVCTAPIFCLFMRRFVHTIAVPGGCFVLQTSCSPPSCLRRLLIWSQAIIVCVCVFSASSARPPPPPPPPPSSGGSPYAKRQP